MTKVKIKFPVSERDVTDLQETDSHPIVCINMLYIKHINMFDLLEENLADGRNGPSNPTAMGSGQKAADWDL